MTNHITTPCLPQLKTKATADLSTIGSIQSKPVFRIALGNFCKPCSRPNSTRCSAARAMSGAPITRVAGWRSTLTGKPDGMPVCLIGQTRDWRISERASQPRIIFPAMFGQIARVAMRAPLLFTGFPCRRMPKAIVLLHLRESDATIHLRHPSRRRRCTRMGR
jgi:hypothetical protein